MPAPTKSEKRSLQTDLANSVNAQMKYVFPLIMFPIAYISAVLRSTLLRATYSWSSKNCLYVVEWSKSLISKIERSKKELQKKPRNAVFWY